MDHASQSRTRLTADDLVGAPRFELGTPCTPCKCATRLRHAPTQLFFYEDPSARLGSGRALRANHTLFGDSGAAASAPQDAHELLELDPQLFDDLLALRDIRARLLAGEFVARTTDGKALIIEETAGLP